MYFLLTRPEEDSRAIAQTLTRLGHQVHCAPLLHMDYYDRPEIVLADFQVLLFTSANGVRAFIRISQSRNIPCYTVGDATAAEATKAGFHTVISAGGDVSKLAALVITKLSPDAGRLLHISGKDTAGNLAGQLEKAGFQITSQQLYQATKSSGLSPAAIDLIKSGRISHMPFFSPRTARAFVTLAKAAKIQPSLTKISALCLSSAVSDVISCLNWQNILTAEHPDQSHLFKLINVKLEENRQ